MGETGEYYEENCTISEHPYASCPGNCEECRYFRPR